MHNGDVYAFPPLTCMYTTIKLHPQTSQKDSPWSPNTNWKSTFVKRRTTFIISKSWIITNSSRHNSGLQGIGMDLCFCLHLKSSQSSIWEYILVLLVSPRMGNIIPLIRCCWLTEQFHVGLAFHNRPFVVALFSICHICIGLEVCNIMG